MDFSEKNINISAIKQIDPYFKELLQTAGHVALYRFSTRINEWEKTEIEGALFVYSRTGKPFHNILIMSRLNTNNFIEPVIEGLDLHLEDPYLLYKTVEGSIFCLWFYDKGDCVKINLVLTRLVKGIDGKVNKIPEAGNATGVNLFSMLSKAQEQYNSASQNNNDREPDNTPKSVKDFFMKASQGFQNGQNPRMQGFVGGSQHPMPPRGLESLPEPMGPQPLPLLEKIMLDPQNSVQHIEKQQKTVTPQNELAAFIKANQDQNKVEKQQESATAPPNDVQNNFGFMRISDATSPSDNVQTFNVLKPNMGEAMPVMQTSEENQSLVTDEFPSDTTLMTPMMFSTSPKKNKKTQPKAVEPLTKDQLLQAVQYLLDNDSDFVQKIHEAYVKSFNA